MEYTNETRKLITKIISLLEVGKEDFWRSYFIYTLDRLDKENDKEEIIKSLGHIFMGGMGSFSDLVLHINSIPLIEENNQLEILKDQLFDVCKNALN